MLNKIKDLNVEKKLKTCFTFTVLIASFAGILGLIILLYSNISYNNALVTNGFSQGEIGIFSTYLSKEPIIARELILVNDDASLQECVNQLEETKAATDDAYERMKVHCKSKEELVLIEQIDTYLPEYRTLFEEEKPCGC